MRETPDGLTAAADLGESRREMLTIRRACLTPYCAGQASASGYCVSCEAKYANRRAPRKQRGYDEPWYRFRAVYLAAHPLCQACLERGRVNGATEIHHLSPLLDYPELKYAPTNLVACCHSCHSKLNFAVRSRKKPITPYPSIS